MGDDAREYDFDVALSFAGEDRAYVGAVAAALKDRGIVPFYDEDYATEMWGRDLYSYLDDVYRNRSRLAVVFVSKHYVAKSWTNHERQSAQARALESAETYLLPVRLDDSLLAGLRPTVNYVDARAVRPESLAAMITAKLSAEGGPVRVGVAQPPRHVPRSDDELRRLLETRPQGWEYLLYAAILYRGKSELEAQYRDHQIGYAQRSGRVVQDADIVQFTSDRTAELGLIMSGVERVLDQEAQARAFGAPGVPGSVERIDHLATRLISIYRDLLSWAAEVRGSAPGGDTRPALDLLARLADSPIEKTRAFIDEYVATTDQLPKMLDDEGDEPIVISLSLILDSDESLLNRLTAEMRRLKRRH